MKILKFRTVLNQNRWNFTSLTYKNGNFERGLSRGDGRKAKI